MRRSREDEGGIKNYLESALRGLNKQNGNNTEQENRGNRWQGTVTYCLRHNAPGTY